MRRVWRHSDWTGGDGTEWDGTGWDGMARLEAATCLLEFPRGIETGAFELVLELVMVMVLMCVKKKTNPCNNIMRQTREQHIPAESYKAGGITQDRI